MLLLKTAQWAMCFARWHNLQCLSLCIKMSSIFTEVIQTIHYAEDIQLLNPDVLASKLYANNPRGSEDKWAGGKTGSRLGVGWGS